MLNEIRELDPNNIDGIVYMLCVQRYTKEPPDTLVSLCEQGLKIDPNDFNCNFTLGSILASQKRYSEALLCFDKAILADQSNASSHYNKGVCLQEQQQFNEAIASYKKVTEIYIIIQIGIGKRTFFYKS